MRIDEAIQNLSNEEIPLLLEDGSENSHLIEAHIMAIKALEFQKEYKTKIQKCINELYSSIDFDGYGSSKQLDVDYVISVITDRLLV